MMLAEQQFSLLALIANNNYHPTAFWLAASCVAWLTMIVLPKGLVHVIWGRRLKLPNSVWRSVNLSFVALFLCLALIGLLAQAFTPELIWGVYRLYCQPLALILWPLVLSATLLKINKE
ncbi:MAG: septation protein IspZ [Psychrobium sp.]